ncbi:MAG: DegT/DnrJ/EryC1/StrS family aminotransferase, partial [Desulfobacterales bacterium]
VARRRGLAVIEDAAHAPGATWGEKKLGAVANHVGMPLPAGTMRLYKADDDRSLQFVGEDTITHTPKDEKVRLKIGRAFDVVAERIQTDYRRITSQQHESEWEITIRNHKDESVSVGIVEPLFGNWKIITRSHAYTKEDAFTIRFDVKVPKDGEVKVKYRVRVGL